MAHEQSQSTARPGSDPSETALAGRPGEHLIAVGLRWADMDVYRHINSVEYFRLFEEARARLFTRDGAPGILDRGVVIARQAFDYARPLRYRPAPVSVGLSIERFGTSSLTLACRVLDGDSDSDSDSDQVYATGSASLVAFDPERGSSRPWQHDERNWFAALQSTRQGTGAHT